MGEEEKKKEERGKEEGKKKKKKKKKSTQTNTHQLYSDDGDFEEVRTKRQCERVDVYCLRFCQRGRGCGGRERLGDRKLMQNRNDPEEQRTKKKQNKGNEMKGRRRKAGGEDGRKTR